LGKDSDRLRRNQRIWLALFALGLAGFVLGIAKLFQLRFEAGDIYPAYSSLRADPLGAKAFFESLGKLPDLEVRRNFAPLDQLRETRDMTLFYFGIEAEDLRLLDENLATQWEALASNGGRLVLSLLPLNTRPLRERWRGDQAETAKLELKKSNAKKSSPKSPPTKQVPDKSNKDRPSGLPRLVSLAERWGFGLGYADLPRNEVGSYASVIATQTDTANLPSRITWHTALYFSPLDKSWRVIYWRDRYPVIIQRRWGKGTLVISADSFYLSNEAMRDDRYPELLAWLVGRSTKVVFDEVHLGVAERAGIATLARKYRLHGVIAGVILLASLFVWKNATRFMPPYEEEVRAEHGELVAGKDSAAGFVNLLRRSISSRDILSVCFVEWKKTCTHGRADLGGKVERMQAVMNAEETRPAGVRNPLATYRDLAQILGEKRGM
jgi:hypothetical protein